MNTKNEDQKPSDNIEALKQEASACGPGCGCHAAGPSNRVRWIVGAIIILAAGVLVARAMLKNNSASTEKAVSGFAALPTAGQAPTPVANAVPVTDNATTVPVAVAVKEIGALSELNAVAADTGGVFVFLAGKNDPLIKAPLAQMRNAAKTIEAQGQKIGLFTLKTDSPDYTQVAAQTSVPCVLAMVKGRGMIPVSGDITETKLIQGFVAASSGGGCGPSSGGCGPAGCN
ncbi:MAG: hypothetical protein KJ964_11645 [Verrucomicrobia bacterium]|nr:hypothetical protein [Verrucomicrobiota bacterium]MBU1735611.1 hypothetical protein [Verrucomicrobiota bacterium]MBU1855875.1 hypothetical protein [Verrucomicrobiota bacterium]